MNIHKKSSSQIINKLVYVVFFLIISANFSYANELKPENVNIVTPVYRPVFSDFKPAFGTYEYKVSWQGIPAADIIFSVNQVGLDYELTTKVKSYKAIDLFYKLRHKATGLVSGIDLLPKYSFFETKENSKVKTAKITYLPNGEITSERMYKDKESTVTFNPNNFTLDPFSASFLARSLSWEKGQERKFDTYNGRNRYLITLKAVDETKMKVNGSTRLVWVIEPTVQKLTSNKKGKLRKARIYITADKSREVLRIDSDVLIGKIKSKLVSFEPTSKPVIGARVASLKAGTQEISFK